ncbi:hypothetical protein TWF506_003566 [Arthrobotrys conoides]|uniref:O-fucosyltransferase family protein n=1 Tax=Arthrobotrys conoides TaxID=74498 RepID=A0AAN8N2D7_9PEZI
MKSQTESPQESSPVIIQLATALFSFPPSFDPPSVADSFGFILEFRPDLSGIADTIIDRIQQTSGVGNASEYLGLHLRTEADAKGEWASWDDLTNTTISTALENNMKTIYVASGDKNSVARLVTKADKIGIKVVDKWSILGNGDEATYLESFNFDQQGIVDYLALMQSNIFIGSAGSSFSSHVVTRRQFLDEHDPTFNGGDTKGGRAQKDKLTGGARLGFWDMDWP